MYDVVSIIIFSASVNILVWGFTVTPDSRAVEFYIPLALCFLLLAGSGWCLYWLHDELEYSLQQTAGIEEAAIDWIQQRGTSWDFRYHFIGGVVGFVLGIATFWLIARM